MLIRQTKNTFIRTTESYGYVTNQLTRQDRTYNESGADWLKEINRVPQDIDEIVNRLCSLYEDADFDVIKNDFMQFVESLSQAKFIVIGETAEELDAKDEDFTYNIELPKTLSDNFYQETKEKVSENTQDFFLEQVQGKPLISSLQFELSSRCNERCIHCYIPNDKKNKGFDALIDALKNMFLDGHAASADDALLGNTRHKDALYRAKEAMEHCMETITMRMPEDFISLDLQDANRALGEITGDTSDDEIIDRIFTKFCLGK